MVLKQYYLGCLAHASYLVADEASGRAAVVDPQRDVGQYIDDAADIGCRIGHVFLTHFHADFVAGHLELRHRVGATIHLGARASAEYAFHPMADGDDLDLGSVRLRVVETPGHSPESISILVYDLSLGSDTPHAVLTGDTLFVGDVGRPDLRASLGWQAEDLAAMLYDSLHRKLLALPDDTLVYPAHGAGSLCGRNLSTDTVSTIGVQRAFNYALQPMEPAQFIDLVTADQPDAPAYFTYDAIMNTKEHSLLDETLQRTVAPMSLEQLLAERARVQILDTRDPAEFAGAHLAGSINVGLGGSFATWCGSLLDPDRPVAIVAEPGREEEAATRLGRIGFDNVAGFLAGSLASLDGRPELVSRVERVTAAVLADLLASDDPPTLVDVRSPSEWAGDRIEGSINVPLSRLPEQMRALSDGGPVVVCCASGYRSSIASSLFLRDGLGQVHDLVGGVSAWRTTRLPMARA